MLFLPFCGSVSFLDSSEALLVRCVRRKREGKGLEFEKKHRAMVRSSIDAFSLPLFTLSPPPLPKHTLYTSPTMVVPVFFSRGATTPRCSSTALREHRSNEKPPEFAIFLLMPDDDDDDDKSFLAVSLSLCCARRRTRHARKRSARTLLVLVERGREKSR